MSINLNEAKILNEETGRIMTPEFRVSFPHVFESIDFKNNKVFRFTITMLFSKKANIEGLKQVCIHAVNKKWANKKPSHIASPFRDGNDPDKIKYDGYADHIYVNAKSKIRPVVLNRNMESITDPDEFYAGCYARAVLYPVAYSTGSNNGVSFWIKSIQKTREGTPFTGDGISPEEDFSAMPLEKDVFENSIPLNNNPTPEIVETIEDIF